jgi:hypothetical protein
LFRRKVRRKVRRKEKIRPDVPWFVSELMGWQ